MTKELKPCPCCGKEATTFAGDIDMYGSIMYGVICKNTACCMIPSKYPSKEAAIKAWNKREPIDKIVKQLEKVVTDEADLFATEEINYDSKGNLIIRSTTDLHSYALRCLDKAIKIVESGGKV